MLKVCVRIPPAIKIAIFLMIAGQAEEALRFWGSPLTNFRRNHMRRSSRVRAISFVAVIATVALTACSKTADEPKEATAVPVPAPVAETAPAPTSENVKAFMIGELSAMALRDGGMELPNDNKVFGVGRTPEEVAAVLSAAGLPTDKLALTIEPLLVKDKG